MKKHVYVRSFGWPYVPLARDGAEAAEEAKRL